ncbi:MAG: hypothetical protein J6Y60_03320 [Treponema sp.]|nr:hypothetical protein [Treponema sp.]
MVAGQGTVTVCRYIGLNVGTRPARIICGHVITLTDLKKMTLKHGNGQ